MKKGLLVLLGALVIFISCRSVQVAENTLTPAEKTAGWQLLFDGKTTTGWRSFNSDTLKGGWAVQDGMLVNTGGGGDIVYDKPFADFELSLEWKIEAEGNSGIFYHVLEGPEFHGPPETGPEYQLIDDTGYPGKLEEWQKTGADYAMHLPGPNKTLNPAGEWNLARIVFHNGHVEHWLNDEKILEFQAWTKDWEERVADCKWKDYPHYGKAKSGVFALQDHGKQICFRNIKARAL